MASTRPVRSVLYIPGSKERALERAMTLPTDAIIFDLEDAVAPEEKPRARQVLSDTLAQNDYGPRLRVVRINALGSEWGDADARAFANHPGADAILLPKVDRPADLDALAVLTAQKPQSARKPLWAMMETAQGMLNAQAIAAHPQLAAMVMGTNDLAKELGSRHRPDRLALITGLGLCLLAARAAGKLIVDGVFNAYLDEEGLRAECEQGRDMGFDGKTLIHPAQLAIANAAFAPSEAEVDLARRQIAAFDAARAAGQGVAVVDGKIVENLHVVTATTTLARAAAIAEQGF